MKPRPTELTSYFQLVTTCSTSGVNPNTPVGTRVNHLSQSLELSFLSGMYVTSNIVPMHAPNSRDLCTDNRCVTDCVAAAKDPKLVQDNDA